MAAIFSLREKQAKKYLCEHSWKNLETADRGFRPCHLKCLQTPGLIAVPLLVYIISARKITAGSSDGTTYISVANKLLYPG